MAIRRTAAEIIAFHFGWDIRDVQDCRYQPTQYASPAIYTIGNSYYAAPSNNVAPKSIGEGWKEVGRHYGRAVFEWEPK